MIDESCYYTIGDLRWLLWEDANYIPPIINEAYFGRKPVAKMQEALSDVCAAVREDPYVVLNGSNVARKLEKTICETFGFNSCSIYWSNRPGELFPLASGACTFVQSIGFKFDDNKAYAESRFKDGYYDHNHELDVIIVINQIYIVDGGLTDEEVMAVLLHEIGHNFDHTMWKIFGEWLRLAKRIRSIVKLVMMGFYNDAINTALGTALGTLLGSTKIGREIAVYIMNIDNVIMDVIPPLGYIARKIGRPITPIIKLFQNFKRISDDIRWYTSSASNLAIDLAFVPIEYISSTPTRKGEQYADRFAATYGYAKEQMSGLDKLQKYTIVQDGPFHNTILAPFYDLMLMRYDMLAAAYGDHGSNQQRAIWMMKKLDDDMKESGLTPAQKKIILKERDRLAEFYDDYVNEDVEVRNVFTQTFRKMMDSWYNGKPYILFPNLEAVIDSIKGNKDDAKE